MVDPPENIDKPTPVVTPGKTVLHWIMSNVTSIMTFVAIGVVLILALVPSRMIIFLPSPALYIDPQVTVVGHPLRPHRGHIFITFVEEPQASILSQLIYSIKWIHPESSILDPIDVYGTATAPPAAKTQRTEQQMMQQSQHAAPDAAFYYLGLESVMTKVRSIAPYSKATGVLFPGDVLMTINGHSLIDPALLFSTIQATKAGQKVVLGVKRGAQSLMFRIPTVAHSGMTQVGFKVDFSLTGPHVPKIKINAGSVQGSSAGLMFALSIVNRMSATDLTHGHYIAGTGEIDEVGDVYPIEGIKQKIIGAKSAGAQYFLVPADNWKEAQGNADGLKLVKVSTLANAVAFLKTLG